MTTPATTPATTPRGVPQPGAPLRIGILGAARIAREGIIEPARALGHRVVAVAARSRERAEAFAAEHGVERVPDGYAALVADPEVEVVYNALVNSRHAEWSLAALAAGKHVLSEKPLTSNATQARQVRDAAAARGLVLAEGFHYLHHPVNRRLADLVTSGALGEVREVEVELRIPAPPEEDPRWSLELAGGATMDLGCYVLSALRHTGRWLGEPVHVRRAAARLHGPQVDAAVEVEVGIGDLVARGTWDMAAADRLMTWTVRGSEGTATSPAFAVPHQDNRLVLTDAGGTVREEVHGDQTSYTCQLRAFAESVRRGVPFLVDGEDAVANADLVDGVYAAAGLQQRR